MDPAVYGEVVEGGLEILADGDDVTGVGVGRGRLEAVPPVQGFRGCGFFDDVVEELVDFFFSFSDSDHDAGFGDSALGFDAGEELDRAIVLSAGSDGGVASADGFDIVGDDVGLGIDDHL